MSTRSSGGIARLARAAGRTVGRATARGALDWLRGRPRRGGTPGRAQPPVPEVATRRPRRGGSNTPAPEAARPGPGSDPGAYPGDFHGIPDLRYAPEHDGSPDPGEVVWTWVPFEEDHAKGKDRPVLVVGHDGPWLLALMLTSRDHDRDEAEERRRGRQWLDIGAGTWDPRGRPSEVRLDRILRLDPERVRREGAVLARQRFDEVADAVRTAHRSDTPKGPVTGG